MSASNRYTCNNVSLPDFPEADNPCWDKVPRGLLSDTVTGNTPFLLTEFRLLRSDTAGAFILRFKAEDDAVRSTFRLHEDCLYRQDVLEVFINEGDDMRRYREIEVSPYDMHFTAAVANLSPDDLKLDMDWDIPGFETKPGSASGKTRQSLSGVFHIPPLRAAPRWAPPGVSMPFGLTTA